MNFSYCRSPGTELPCGKVFDCWWERFDVKAFVEGHWTPEQIALILSPRKPKILTLVELIQKARSAADR